MERRFSSGAMQACMVGVALAALVGCEGNPAGTKAVRGPLAIQPADTTLVLGGEIRFRVTPGHGASWSVVEGPGHGIISGTGLYHAPFILPPDSGATIRAEVPGAFADATVSLQGGAADTMACLGAGQSELPEPGGDLGVHTDPIPLVRVPPEYPDAAREAGIEGTVVVNALVCRSGLVLETRIETSVPMLDEAASRAVEQWVFVPALRVKEPIAAWLAIPIRFSLN